MPVEAKSLPIFKVERDLEEGWLVVTCPRKDCGGEFLVDRKPWVKKRKFTTSGGKEVVITGRPCPYCSRVSQFPKRIPR